MKTCSLCGKKTKIGRNRSHAQNRTPRTFEANIQKVTLKMGEGRLSGYFCAKCVKRLKYQTKREKAASL